MGKLTPEQEKNLDERIRECIEDLLATNPEFKRKFDELKLLHQREQTQSTERGEDTPRRSLIDSYRPRPYKSTHINGEVYYYDEKQRRISSEEYHRIMKERGFVL